MIARQNDNRINHNPVRVDFKEGGTQNESFSYYG